MQATVVGEVDEHRGSSMSVLQAAQRDRTIGRGIRAAAPWLGLLLVLILSSLPIDRTGPAPTQRNWVFGRLNREHTFEQTFIAAPGELVAVRVLLFANPGGGDAPVTLRLRDTQGDLPDLAAVTLPLRALSQDNWTTFDIPPLTLSLTSSLRLELAAPTLPPNQWITVMAGRDTYTGGELWTDGRARPAVDLSFQPVYRGRWIDRLLPISRMAVGKPGLLGWPPLYALLAYGSSVILARLLLALWRGGRRG